MSAAHDSPSLAIAFTLYLLLRFSHRVFWEACNHTLFLVFSKSGVSRRVWAGFLVSRVYFSYTFLPLLGAKEYESWICYSNGIRISWCIAKLHVFEL